MTADEIASIIESAAARHGVPADALMAIANLESSGNIAAENPRSSASGLFQFVDSTANEYGLTGSKRNDPAAQADAAARMMATNARSLGQTLGRQPNAGELYLAHQQGLGGARALLANPNRPAVDVLTGVYGSREKAVNALRLNGGQMNQSAGQFAGQWIDKANQRAALIPPGSIPNTVASVTDTQRPQQVMGASQAPTSAASRQVPTNWFTPRIAPDNADIYSYHIPDQTPTSVVGGLGSLTPDRAPPPRPPFRPFTTGEYIDNGDGTRSTERTITWQMDNGAWINTPTLFMGPNGPIDLSKPEQEAQARNTARVLMNAGYQFPSYTSEASAVNASKAKSGSGGVGSGVSANNARLMQSLPPQGGFASVPLPRPRPAVAEAPIGFPTPLPPPYTPGPAQRLPELPPSNLATGNVITASMDRANAARDPELQAALNQRIAPPGMIDASMARVANAVDPALQRALEARNGSGVGLPPRVSVAASVPMPVPPAIPGPSAAPKGQERLAAGVYPMPPVPDAVPSVASALDVVPAVPGFPPMPRPRPVPFSMPTAMGQRPTLPMPRAAFGFPTAANQRPIPQPTMRIAVNGAGSYGGQSAPQQQRFELNGKEVRPVETKYYNPDTNQFENRTVYR